jgi:hypothetical protein
MLHRFAHNTVVKTFLCLAMLVGMVVVGALCAGEEVLILDTQKTDTLLDCGTSGSSLKAATGWWWTIQGIG